MTAVKSLAVLVLASVVLATHALIFKDCGKVHLFIFYINLVNNHLILVTTGSVYGKVRSVAVSGCETSNTCILKSGSSANFTVVFTSCKFFKPNLYLIS